MASKKINKKETGTDKFARMIQRGFSSVTEDISDLRKELRGGFEEVDRKFQEVGRQFQIVNHKIDTLTRRVDAMADYNRRIARLERIVDSLIKT